MAEQKKVTVYVSRSFTLNRPEQEPLRFTAGANLIDADVAEHPYVKANMTDPDAVQVSGKELDAAQARIAELEKQVAEQAATIDALVASASVTADPAQTGKKK